MLCVGCTPFRLHAFLLNSYVLVYRLLPVYWDKPKRYDMCAYNCIYTTTGLQTGHLLEALGVSPIRTPIESSRGNKQIQYCSINYVQLPSNSCPFSCGSLTHTTYPRCSWTVELRWIFVTVCSSPKGAEPQRMLSLCLKRIQAHLEFIGFFWFKAS